MARRLLLSTIATLLISTSASAQTPAATPAAGGNATAAPAVSARDEAIKEMVQLARKRARSKPTVQQPFLSVIDDQAIATYRVAMAHDANPSSDAGKLVDSLLARAVKQLGSTSTSTAGTTIASKGLVPEILGVAVESGAVNRDSKDTTLTFQVTPMGVVKALQGKGLLDVYADYSSSPSAHFASRFSMSASFDTSRGTSGTFTGEGNQLSAWTVRAKVVDGRDPSASNNAAGWAALLNASTTDSFKTARSAVNAALAQWKGLDNRRQQLRARVEKEVDSPFKTKTIDLATAERTFQRILDEEMPKVVDKVDEPADVGLAIDKYVKALANSQADIDKIYSFAEKGPIVTVEWSTARDKALPDLYTVTAIFEVGLGKERATDFTANAASVFYKSTPIGADHSFKSFDLNAQLDHPLGKIFNGQSLLFTIAARYSHLPNDTVTSTSTTGAGLATAEAATAAAPALKGNIGVIQFKFTLPVTKGVQVPLSITASNRTELIKESDVRASFGITFDLDSVLGIMGIK